MFTDGLDPSAVEWVKRDFKKDSAASPVLVPSIDVPTPNFPRESVLSARLAGKGWGLPPTQLHSSHFHSGLLHAQIPAPVDELDESVGSISGDGHNLDSSDSDCSVDSSPNATVYNTDYERFDCTKDDPVLRPNGIHIEASKVDKFYYAYDQRLLSSRPNSKSNSRCNSQRESFGCKESCPSNHGGLKDKPRAEYYEDSEELAPSHSNAPQCPESQLRISPGCNRDKYFDGDFQDDGSLDEHYGELEETLAGKNLGNRMAELMLNVNSESHVHTPASMQSRDMHRKTTFEGQCIEGCDETCSGNIGASPSAPPMMGSVSIEASGDVVVDSAPSISQSCCRVYSENSDKSLRAEARTMFTVESERRQQGDNSFSEHISRPAFMNGGEETDRAARQMSASTSQHIGLHFSGHGAWQSLIAYDACVRLCLRAWARGCIEAPEFLLDECSVLQNAFGLQQVLLQPQDNPLKNLAPEDMEVAAAAKPKNYAGKLKVQVRKVRIFPRQVLQSISSQRGAAYMQAGTQYMKQVSGLLKAGVKTFRNTAIMETQESYPCHLRLKSAAAEEAEQMQPGGAEMHVFHPQSPSDDLFVEVHDCEGTVLGCAVVPLSSISDDPVEQVRWWPIYNEVDHECVGKVQLFINYSLHSSESCSNKWSHVSETVAYNTVLEAALRAQNFQQRNLRLHGPWKWLLTEFGIVYGVSDIYSNLRYLSCVMEIATPTEDCLMLIHDLLSPILKAQVETSLNRQEKRMLVEVEDRVEQLISMVFENYKCLDESSPSGMREVLAPVSGKAAPVLAPAVKIFTLLHDILVGESQRKLCTYFQRAAKKRCRLYMKETDDFVASNAEGFLMDSITMSAAYAKMKTLCANLSNEVRTDIEMHNQHILPSSIDLPNITAEIYSTELSSRLKAFLIACPPPGPSSPVLDLLVATADFQQDLTSWKIIPTKGSVNAKELFHLYIDLWIQDKRLNLLEFCKLDKVRWTGSATSNGTSPFVEEMYERIKETLNEYDVLLNRWPEYTITLETAVADVESAIIAALEKQFADVLMPLKDVMATRKFSLQYVQKLTRRRSLSLYSVPSQFGVFLNTIKRLLDTLRPKMEAQMKSWVACVPLESGRKSCFGERLNEVTVLLRAKYKNFIQAIVEKLADNARLQATTKLKRILQDTREAGGESEIRDRMQPLNTQVLDTISHLHDVFSSRVFVAICRGYWDRLGQDVLHFLENRKENRSWYKGSYFALQMLDDTFASQMQKMQGHALQEKDLDPPRSVLEARSMLSKDAPNGLDSNYFYF